MPAPILSKTTGDLVAVVKSESAKIAEAGQAGIKSALAIGRIGLDVDNKGILPHGESGVKALETQGGAAAWLLLAQIRK